MVIYKFKIAQKSKNYHETLMFTFVDTKGAVFKMAFLKV